MAAHLVDAQGRTITYVRLGVNESCNFRCVYCSVAERERGALSPAEIARLMRLLRALGVVRVRLTGGEPTLRKDLVDIVRAVRSVVAQVALTTNGSRLAPLAAALRDAGLSAVNVSLDTLDPKVLVAISGARARLEDVFAGLDAAAACGVSVSTNTVVQAGVNERELGAIVRHAWARGATPRFIELMPFAGGVRVPLVDIERVLSEDGISLSPSAVRGFGPAHYANATDARTRATGLVGFIAPIGDRFCASCNRLRIGATGALRACLGGVEEVQLGAMLRAGASDAELEAAIHGALAAKRVGHAMDTAPKRRLLPMMGMGG